jgi:UTP--glucose-1-phosphate uridylyltransferase
LKQKVAVIPAGGYGSRMEPITKAIPKPMLPIIRKPVIHHIVEECSRSGVEKVVIIAGFRGDVIKNYFTGDSEFDSRSYGPENYFDDIEIEFIQQNKPNGLADAVLCAENAVEGGSFSVLLGDDIFLNKDPGIAQLYRSHSGGHIVGVVKMPTERLYNYGVVVPSEQKSDIFCIKEIVEKPKKDVGSNLSIAGRYIFDISIFDRLRQVILEKGVEANLTDALNLVLAEGHIVMGLILEGRRYDVGNETEYIDTLSSALREGWY